jgi:thioredoxin 1
LDFVDAHSKLLMLREVSSESEFNSILNDPANRNRVVIVDFYAPWCGPCVRFAPRFQELAEMNPDVVFVKVNVDELDELAAMYSI